tara:strand:+ start:15024 stop:15422 length:399 start_codon:yes stop_codon:yes gene_type:complete
MYFDKYILHKICGYHDFMFRYSYILVAIDNYYFSRILLKFNKEKDLYEEISSILVPINNDSYTIYTGYVNFSYRYNKIKKFDKYQQVLFDIDPINLKEYLINHVDKKYSNSKIFQLKNSSFTYNGKINSYVK